MTKKLMIASRVSRIEKLSARVRRFTVEPVHRSIYPAAEPGSHVLVRHPEGVLRSYSLCGDDPSQSTYQFAVLREDSGRGGSMAFHSSLQHGDPIHVSYPIPSLPLDDRADEHIFLAGGIGVTPFVPLALEARRRQQPASAHYAVRGRSDAAFLPTLRSVEGLTTKLYVGSDGERLNVAALVSSLPLRAHLYVCGPGRLLEAASIAASSAGLTDRVHLESFSGLDSAEARSGEPFVARLSLSKRDVPVPADRSLLQALHDDGIDVDSSCEGGVCGACRVTLLAGDALHRDACLTPDQRAQNIITCVSRGTGAITLHL